MSDTNDYCNRVIKPAKQRLDSLFDSLDEMRWKTSLDSMLLYKIANAGFRFKTQPIAAVATELIKEEHPITVRGVMYRVVSAGVLPDTSNKSYERIVKIVKALREKEIIPFDWIRDNLRSTIKPSSWSGLNDFTETVQRAYRLDFWARLPVCVHIFCEKDAIAGVIQPVTAEFDVALSPLRGYVSLSYLHEIAEQWNRIDKPIFAYYLGDHDPSGIDIERDLVEKIQAYCHRPFSIERLGILPDDFESFSLVELAVKKSDRRAKDFIASHGERCAEIDALPPTEIRHRVREAITQHVPEGKWEQLRAIEAEERRTFDQALNLVRH